jgi:membrane protease YdiL (CAAX protease family)
MFNLSFVLLTFGVIVPLPGLLSLKIFKHRLSLLNKVLIVYVIFCVSRALIVQSFGMVFPKGFSWRWLLPNWKTEYLYYILASYEFALFIPFIKSLLDLSWRDVGWRREKLLRNVFIGLLLSIPASIVVFFVPTAPLMVYLLTAVTFSFKGGWVEENIYRGYFVKAFEGRMSWVRACLLQALLFAVGHTGVWLPTDIDYVISVIFATIFGTVLGLLRYRTNNIIPSFLTHFITNIFSHSL